MIYEWLCGLVMWVSVCVCVWDRGSSRKKKKGGGARGG